MPRCSAGVVWITSSLPSPSALNDATRLLSKQMQSSSWMALLLSNARRIRRKLFSRRPSSVVAFLTALLLLLYYTTHVRVPDEVVVLPQYTSNVDDPTIDWTKIAYVQYADSLEKLCKALMLFSELKEVSSVALRVLFYPNTWSINADKSGDIYDEKAHIALLLRYAVEGFSVVLNPTDTLWSDPYANFLAYNLTQFDRVIILGHDSIVLNSMDELFFLPPAPLAMPYVHWSEPAGWRLSNQIMVIQPSSDEFAKIEKEIQVSAEDGTDIGLINKLYNNESLIRLPQRPFHILTEEFRRMYWGHSRYLGAAEEKWNVKGILRETKLVHFDDPPIPKPWTVSNASLQMYRPRCIQARYRGYRKMLCDDRDAWSRFYSEYLNRRKNVCGIGP